MKNHTEHVEYSSFVERWWNKAIDSTTDDPLFLWTFGIHITMFIIYWGVGCIYIYLDVMNPAWVEKYKVQPGKNQPVDRVKLKKVIKRVIYNQIVNGLLYSAITIYPLKTRGNFNSIREVPSLVEFIYQFTFCVIIREISFYYSHRLLHMSGWYEKYHKQHHEWTAPVAVSAQYAGSVEHLFSNLMPVTIGISILKAPYFTAMMYLIHVNLRTLNDHSGYHFPYYYNPSRHDKHHESFNCYYGVIGLMDWVHGTSGRVKKRETKCD